jgi:putative acetyltransferase
VSAPRLRRYHPTDETLAIELWRRSWQTAYPASDFSARVAWWRERWRRELVPQATIVVAERDAEMLGFVTIDPETGYLDQLVVAPEAWGSELAATLLAEAQSLSPRGLDLHVNHDNARAIRFYEKHGLVITGQTTNPRSRAPVHAMSWRPRA